MPIRKGFSKYCIARKRCRTGTEAVREKGHSIKVNMGYEIKREKEKKKLGTQKG